MENFKPCHELFSSARCRCGDFAAPPMLSGSSIIPSDPIPYRQTGPTLVAIRTAVCLPEPIVGPPPDVRLPRFEDRGVKALCRLYGAARTMIGRDRMFTRRSMIHLRYKLGYADTGGAKKLNEIKLMAKSWLRSERTINLRLARNRSC
jgi:hypothetical protein